MLWCSSRRGREPTTAGSNAYHPGLPRRPRTCHRDRSIHLRPGSESALLYRFLLRKPHTAASTPMARRVAVGPMSPPTAQEQPLPLLGGVGPPVPAVPPPTPEV